MRTIAVTPLRVWLLGILLLVAGALGAYVAQQQLQRHAANDPQLQLAQDGALALERGRTPAQLISDDTVDIAHSLAPFVIVLDDTGKPVASSGRLDGQVPVPPTGVLDGVRRFGEERVTWAPRRSVRLASVVHRVNGAQPGFIVAARSLGETEWRIARLGRLILTAWLAGAVAWTALVGLVTWVDRRR
jgi:hypothetical protein